MQTTTLAASIPPGAAGSQWKVCTNNRRVVWADGTLQEMHDFARENGGGVVYRLCWKTGREVRLQSYFVK